MDKLQAIVHRVLEALSKARELNTLALDPDAKASLAQLMKKTANSRKKLQAFANASATNGKLDKATLDRGLDRALKAIDEVNRELDELLAKARG
jgi:hypothetical protein